jgi:hypothetical protein
MHAPRDSREGEPDRPSPPNGDPSSGALLLATREAKVCIRRDLRFRVRPSADTTSPLMTAMDEQRECRRAVGSCLLRWQSASAPRLITRACCRLPALLVTASLTGRAECRKCASRSSGESAHRRVSTSVHSGSAPPPEAGPRNAPVTRANRFRRGGRRSCRRRPGLSGLIRSRAYRAARPCRATRPGPPRPGLDNDRVTKSAACASP